jgi:hypothetical protein
MRVWYYTYGGLNNDFNSVDIDVAGNVYATGRVTGSNNSTDLISVKYYRNFNHELWGYQYANGDDSEFFGSGVRADPLSFTYVTGRNNADVLVAKFETDGASIRDSLTVGGSGQDGGSGIAVRPANTVYIAGRTTSADFPVTSGVFQETYGGGASDGLVMKVSSFT